MLFRSGDRVGDPGRGGQCVHTRCSDCAGDVHHDRRCSGGRRRDDDLHGGGCRRCCERQPVLRPGRSRPQQPCAARDHGNHGEGCRCQSSGSEPHDPFTQALDDGSRWSRSRQARFHDDPPQWNGAGPGASRAAGLLGEVRSGHYRGPGGFHYEAMGSCNSSRTAVVNDRRATQSASISSGMRR